MNAETGAAPALIAAPHLADVPGLVCAVTLRDGGVSPAPFASLNLGLGTEDDPENVATNRRRVAHALGFDALTTPYQVHGADACSVDTSAEPRPRADALIVQGTGRLVGVLGADCPGVLLVDADNHVLAVVHSGWRGTAASIVTRTIHRLHADFGTDVSNLRAWVGPAIGAERYEVDAPVIDALTSAVVRDGSLVDAGVAVATRPGHATVDLRSAIALQLAAAGVRAAHVVIDDSCTHAEPQRLFSHRRDGARTGRHAMVAGWVG